MKVGLTVFALAVLTLTACQTGATSETPAYLADASDEALFVLPGQVAQAFGVANVKLGPMAKEKPGAVSVLPRPGSPLEGNNPDTPTTYDLVLRGTECFLKDRASGDVFELTDVACLPL